MVLVIVSNASLLPAIVAPWLGWVLIAFIVLAVPHVDPLHDKKNYMASGPHQQGTIISSRRLSRALTGGRNDPIQEEISDP